MPRKYIFALAGPLAFVLILSLVNTSPEFSPEARAILASTLWIAIWWISEAVPIAVSSLLPLVLFPLSGAMSINDTAAPYSRPIIYLYAGGFIIALAMEKWDLHRRIALNIIAVTGTNMRQLVLGFMIATAFLSMWISNTATSVMMLPIGIAIIHQLLSVLKYSDKDQGAKDFGKALMLGIAYAASIGGVATLVGTPTNLVLSGFVRDTYDIDLSFSQWMLFGLPISVLLIGISWWHLTMNAYKLGKGTVEGSEKIIKTELAKLGSMKSEEKWVAIIFSLVALAWIFRKKLINPVFPAVDDSIIALSGAIVLFLIPARSKEQESLMDWKTALGLPWGILLLFGAGFAIAKGFEVSGLAAWLGLQLSALKGIPFIVMLLVIVFMVNFLTEMTSNVATCTLILPILAELAPAVGIHPFGLMVGACIAASCAFMLPVATPPNAVVFGSGYLKISDMVRVGFLLNIISIIVVTLAVYFLLPIIWGIDLQVFPADWAN